MQPPPTSPPSCAAVVIVEDDPRTRAHLCAALDGQSGFRLAACFERAQPAIAWLDANRADVLLTDLGLPDGSGIDVIHACAARHPRCDIMVITMFGDEKNVLSSIEAGASGYLLKDAAQLDVVRAITELRAGGSPMSPLIARRVLLRARVKASAAEVNGPSDPASLMGLTRREAETLDLIARGYTYAEVAQLLAVTVGTVQTHIKSIYGKLAVHSRSEAVFEAHKLGLLRAGLFDREES
ncbi:MAG TPA: response regulator transcription factor [Burkholderiaceae bacterium]|nr:response regulator transcription factor [Burkholderiaceae bacterium]